MPSWVISSTHTNILCWETHSALYCPSLKNQNASRLPLSSQFQKLKAYHPWTTMDWLEFMTVWILITQKECSTNDAVSSVDHLASNSSCDQGFIHQTAFSRLLFSIPQTLLNKLAGLALCPYLCQWALDLWTNRPQLFKNMLSSPIILYTALPQLLCPLLWLMTAWPSIWAVILSSLQMTQLWWD